MTDYIIVALIVVVLFFALRAGVKRLRGETSCCGGSTYKAHSRKLTHVAEKMTFTVAGMHCQHCVNRVMEAINSMEGVSAQVHLNRGEAVVSSEKAIDEAAVRSAVEKAGYTVTGVR